MSEKLLTFLGVGDRNRQLEAQLQDRKYKRVRYFLPDTPDREIETPFVGQAILELHPDRFSQVVILGTVDSMWDTLLIHFLSDTQTEAEIDLYTELFEAIENKREAEVERLLPRLARVLEKRWRPGLQLKLIPVGRTQEELWRIFETLTGLKPSNTTLSIDITHGLRYQPFFLLLALQFFHLTRPGVRLGSVFYGALELHDYYAGRAPLFDLRPMLELMQWSLGAQAFVHYQDPEPLLELLRNTAQESLRHELRQFARQINLNLFNNFRERARKLSHQLRGLSQRQENLPAPFRLVEPFLVDFCETFASAKSDWEALLRLARRHLKYRRPALAVLAAHEAVVHRLGEVYGVNPAAKNPRGKRYGSQLVLTLKYPRVGRALPELKELVKAVDELQTIRNNTAHFRTDAEGPDPGYRLTKIRTLLTTLEEKLGHPALEQLPRLYPLERQ
ncbi:TIGR02221 family CRISPR-associated protein [Rhodothermus marinus]|uniref:CRISPR-associated protein DxTHG motif protein n=1 Tax=Rhodothermus marinus (strain ATCC 43812 / DSM 4252 / R-10) TaxID=518766 RepID=D0MKP0_RHOM4|nr:TIGR02221 family CRISPR-associated protein [Rhodothermus marinus]ACY49704.1 CRISPR-associated protein DxTHG motif protein [Rhodothermus marinus DSM 4252]AEN74759.1 CRISPR-associated protein DxTHG motif protein [Rhodothermus marinus SG0.5JP17-172]